MLKYLLRPLLLILVASMLGACSTVRFVEIQQGESNLTQTPGYIVLPPIDDKSTPELHGHCLSLDKTSDIGVALLLRCTQTLLARNDLSTPLKAFAIKEHNNSLLSLVKAKPELDSSLLEISFTGPENFVLVNDMQVKDDPLRPVTFGKVGLAAVVKRQNQLNAADQFYPLEGIYRPHVIYLENIELNGLVLRVKLKVEHIDQPRKATFGANELALKYSPGAAYLALLEAANIDDFSWLGFTNASEAERRRGVFSIGDYSAEKIPLVMIHGLNSDPLIWRFLSMAIFNDKSLNQMFQIWHVYYPSGPPPFYNAMRIRRKLNALLEHLGNPELKNKAVLIGHSMGGLIAKTLSTNPGFQLWDATFTQRPDKLLQDGAQSKKEEVEDVFIFEPVFADNKVFFLDTPHKGSEIASSTIGLIGSSLVSLPGTFTNLFKDFIDKVGINKLTTAMLPFLRDYGPNSVQVLRPGHPLLETLYHITVQGRAYSIIGSDGLLDCQSREECQSISDGVVSYNSADLANVEEKIIVQSSHNSFKSPRAIEFIKQRLKRR